MGSPPLFSARVLSPLFGTRTLLVGKHGPTGISLHVNWDRYFTIVYRVCKKKGD